MHTEEIAIESLHQVERNIHEGGIEAELLLMVSNRLAATKTLEQQLNVIVEISLDATQCERGTIFLADSGSGELYSRSTGKGVEREVRILDDAGVAGAVYKSGDGLIIDDAYSDPRFSATVDQITGFTTRSILCVPIRTIKGEILGVVQCLNKCEGNFTEHDKQTLTAMATQASIVLQSTLYIAKMAHVREVEAEFLDLVAEVSSEIQLIPLLQKIMTAVTRMLDADRSTLFLNDDATAELYTEIGQGLGATRIRLPNHVGIAGTVFQTGKTINIPYAYADLRFDPSYDRKTGYFTRSILCVPVVNKEGKRIGVTQVLNRHGGAFTDEDEARLRAFTAQISIGIENAKLFDDVQQMKNYNESVLESMSNGVVTLDSENRIVTCNAAGLRILRSAAADMLGRTAQDVFRDGNAWVADRIARVDESGRPDVTVDAEIQVGEESVSVNLTTLPLRGTDGQLGHLQLFEDISSEKRVKSTMARYMDPSVADQLLGAGADLLGGVSQEATVLFSDIRAFTTLAEELGAQGTVALLNEYFTIMVDCISREEGMLDKFIGDAIMAIFGTPIARPDDPDRAVRTAISMIRDLRVYNEDRIGHGKKPVDMGVGLNTGMVVSGNIGSPKRMDYTVIGDGVNLASRLEGACKQYGARILISEYTRAAIKGTYRMRDVDLIVVKGKTEPVGVFEVLDYHDESTFPNLPEVVASFRDGIDYYRGQRWDDAISAFQAALRGNPNDRASQVYVARCEHLRAAPPAPDWDGAFVMTTK